MAKPNLKIVADNAPEVAAARMAGKGIAVFKFANYEMRVSFELITPAVAAVYLEKNSPDNRGIIDTRLALLKRDLLNSCLHSSTCGM